MSSGWQLALWDLRVKEALAEWDKELRLQIMVEWDKQLAQVITGQRSHIEVVSDPGCRCAITVNETGGMELQKPWQIKQQVGGVWVVTRLKRPCLLDRDHDDWRLRSSAVDSLEIDALRFTTRLMLSYRRSPAYRETGRLAAAARYYRADRRSVKRYFQRFITQS